MDHADPPATDRESAARGAVRPGRGAAHGGGISLQWIPGRHVVRRVHGADSTTRSGLAQPNYRPNKPDLTRADETRWNPIVEPGIRTRPEDSQPVLTLARDS